jgi:N-acetylmuramoyl-L-alanine amidase
VNLEVCFQISHALSAKGLTVRMTRTEDKFVELSQRYTIANNWNADYFISVHCNSNGPSAVGIETLYKSETGKALATPVQKYLIQETGDVDRGLKYRDNLAVLNGTHMPAILPEIGFISHPATEKKFFTTEYEMIITNAIVKGLMEFLNISEKPVKA